MPTPIWPNGARCPRATVEGDQDQLVREIAAKIDAEYDLTRIKALIENEGWAKA
ncbi:hypothetical protein MASR1M32_29890 [Rhodobacter sp.]